MTEWHSSMRLFSGSLVHYTENIVANVFAASHLETRTAFDLSSSFEIDDIPTLKHAINNNGGLLNINQTSKE